jgi:hypothetical protein
MQDVYKEKLCVDEGQWLLRENGEASYFWTFEHHAMNFL